MNILALDVGTSSVKAAVLNTATGLPVGAIAHVSYAMDAPTPDAAEVPAERLWQAVGAAARSAVRQSGVSGKPGQDVEAVGLSCFTPGLVLLDKKDHPLRPIWTHLDRRARPAARQVWQAVGAEFLATTGNRPLPGGISVTCFRQLLVQDPYLLHDVTSYLHANSWLGFHMTGEKAIDPANASFTGLYGTMTDQKWSRRWCDYFEVNSAWLPRVVSGDATLGNLRAEIAAELGVPAGLPCKLGTADTSSAMLAAGMKAGDLLHELGTTQVLAVLTDKPVPAPVRLTRLFGIGPGFVHVTHNPVGGVALDWLHQLCFRDQTRADFFATTVPKALDQCLAGQVGNLTHAAGCQPAPRGTRVTLDPPFLGGDRLEIEAHRAAFRDLELTTDRLDLLAATLEAMARRHRQAVDALGQGPSYARVFISGGGAELVCRPLPEYQTTAVKEIEEASLRGVAKLFIAH